MFTIDIVYCSVLPVRGSGVEDQSLALCEDEHQTINYVVIE
jgi:hypothetical protein